MNGSDNVIDFSEILGVFKRRKSLFLATFGVVAVLGIIIAFVLPPTYRAESRVFIERQQIPDTLVSTTVTGYVQERLEIISQRVLTPERLMDVAKQLGLPGADFPVGSEEYQNAKYEITTDMIDNTAIETVDVQVERAFRGRSTSHMSVAFIVAYEHKDPTVARDVTNALTQLFLAENVSQRTEQASNVTDFLEQAGGRIKAEIAGIEAELDRLKGQSFEVLPQQVAENRKLLAEKKAELVNAEAEISFLTNRKSQLLAQMAQTNRHVISDRTDMGVVLDPKVRLAKARIDLKNARERFTESHPDVERLQLLIRDLEKDVAQGVSASPATKYSVPTNPAYVRLQRQFDDIDTKLSIAQGNKVLLEERIKSLRVNSNADPAVEIKYNALIRDLARAQKEYADIKDRAYSAELAQSLESEQRGDRFTLMYEATTPKMPVRPNRIGIVMLSVFLGFLASVIVVAIRERGDSTLRTAADLKKVFGAEPIGVIPVIH